MAVRRDALCQARRACGLTQSEAAKLAGYSNKSSWSMVEAGVNTPSVDRMKQMAAVVKRRPSEVFDEFRESAPVESTAQVEAM